jgi:hypothetical protein
MANKVCSTLVLHESQKYVDICDEYQSNLNSSNLLYYKSNKRKFAIDSYDKHVSVVVFEYKIHRKEIFFGKDSRAPTSLEKTSSPLCASELYRPSDRRLSAKLVPIFPGRGCCVVNATNSHGR